MRRIWMLGLITLLACESSSENLPDGGNDAGSDAGQDAGSNDAGQDAGSNDAGQDAGSNDGSTLADPILERTPDLKYDCATKLAVQQPQDLGWSGYGWTYDLVESGGELMFGRVQQTGPALFPPTSVEALISTISSDGTFGPALQINAASLDTISSVSLARLGSNVLFTYVDQSGAHIATISGNTVDGPRPLISSGGTPADLRLVTSETRGAFVYGTRDSNDRYTYVLQTIDESGTPVGAPFEIVRASQIYFNPGVNIAPTPNGWAVAWRDIKTQRGEIYFRLFGLDGQPVSDTKTIFAAEDEMQAGHSVGFEASSIPILVLPNGEILLAWVESANPASFEDFWAMVSVMKLDANGDPIGPRARLAAPEIDFDHVEPELFMYEDAVGLAWGRGEHIYVCAGCIPDHSVRLVLLDPERLVPVSEVAEIDAANGGILFRRTHPIGNDIVSVFRLVFHVHSEAGYAAFNCTPR